MSSFRSPDLLERQKNAATVKKVMLEKFRTTLQDPAVEQQRIKRVAVNEARVARAVERKVVKEARDAELAAHVAHAAELALQTHRKAEKAEALAKAEAVEREEVLAKAQKAERDARYAARKAAKKMRRRGY
jgi:hypothetical protein